MLFFSSQKKWGKIVIVSLPLLFSLVCFIWRIYLLAGPFSWEIMGALILLTYFGLIGLILSAQLENGKIKWVLLGINYFFATYILSLRLFSSCWVIFNDEQSSEQKQMIERRFQFSFIKSDQKALLIL